MNTHDETIKSIIANTDSRGRLRSRERNDLEYKESFSFQNWAKYAKTMAAFSNNQGGYLVFGVKDNPRTVIGVNDMFDGFSQEKLTEQLNSLFSPEIQWDAGVVQVGAVRVGYIYTHMSRMKPVVALKQENSQKICSGDVMYRYRARSEKIKYPEMLKIIEDRVSREREHVIRLLEASRSESALSLGVINYATGRMTTPEGADVVLDRKLIAEVLKKANFIREGSFHETKGTPILRITGNIDIAEEIPVPDIEPDVQYPFLQKDLASRLHLRGHDIYALVWHYGMKTKKKYHIAVATSGANQIHKFSEVALQFLADELNEHKTNPDWLGSIVDRFNRHRMGAGTME